jgi:hypothetical protein
MASITVSLTAEQGEILTVDYGLDPAKVYVVTNDAINASAPVNGYMVGPGAYLLFMDGTMSQHESFLATMFGAGKCELDFKGREMHIYATPASKHVKVENLVTVAIA